MAQGHVYDDADRHEMVRFIPVTTRRMLDVGCSWGAFGEGLRKARPGIEVIGIEPSPDAALKASQRLDRVINGTFPNDVPDDLGAVDCITFNDVLEHFADPWGVLEACKALLAPGGAVVASIPNIRWVETSVPLIIRGEWRYTETGMLDRTHLRFFTRSGIEALFDESGYDIVALQPWNRNAGWRRPTRFLRRFGHRFDDLVCMHFAVAAVARH